MASVNHRQRLLMQLPLIIGALLVILSCAMAKKHHPAATPVPTLRPTLPPHTVAPTSSQSNRTTTPAPSAAKNNTTLSPTKSPAPTQSPTKNQTTIAPTVTPVAPTKAPTIPPAVSPTMSPTLLPTAKPSSTRPTGMSFWKVIGKTIAWLIFIGLGLLAFGAIMSNRYRIYFFLRGVWYTILRMDCTLWILRKLHLADSYSGVDSSLNTVIFDNEMSEGLLMRESGGD